MDQDLNVRSETVKSLDFIENKEMLQDTDLDKKNFYMIPKSTGNKS